MAAIKFTLDGIIFSLEVGGKSINLLEGRGQYRADFWRAVKGGQIIERWHRVPLRL